MSRTALASLVVGAATLIPSARATVFVGFEDLPGLTDRTGTASLADANGGSSTIAGVTWDSRLRVTGDLHRLSGDPSNPLSSIPHGGSFFITNEAYPDAGDAITLQTGLVLTGAWFSQVEYYGFGHGEMTLTIQALGVGGVLGSGSVTLPANATPAPQPMVYLDTTPFTGLVGITGYRILQDPLDPGSRYWSADDFSFQVAAVPEPHSVGIAAVSLATVAAMARRRIRP